MLEICFATNNLGKRNEIVEMTRGHFKIVSLQEIGCMEELPETHNTIEENSIEKAEYVWKNYGISCFADDSGLEVETLLGAPGVYSAMYAGPACNADANIELLLKNMEGKDNRRAQFRTVITLILKGECHRFEGSVQGRILSERQGNGGFGYDPVFVAEGHSRSFALLSIDEKNKISHRGKAVKKLADFLLNTFYA